MPNHNPLEGKCVLVTRAREQADELGAKLRALGATPGRRSNTAVTLSLWVFGLAAETAGAASASPSPKTVPNDALVARRHMTLLFILRLLSNERSRGPRAR